MKVVVTQPYVPQYRRAFFDSVAVRLQEAGGSLRVLHGRPDPRQGNRRDSTRNPWAREVPEHSATVGGVRLNYRRLSTDVMREADVVVHELAATNLNAHRAAISYPHKTLLWGHAGAYTKSANAIDQSIESWLARRCRHVLVYTQGGSDYLQRRGLSQQRITVLRNANDSHALRIAAASVTQHDLEAARLRWRIPKAARRLSLFVGGLDADKRVDFLVDAAQFAHQLDPQFCLLVAGDGEERARLASAQPSGCLVSVGRADLRELAVLGRLAEAIWMPGRVGLVAVDALALGLSIYTAQGARHAPEVEYAVEAGILHELSPDAKLFAAEYLAMSKSTGQSSISIPSIEEMSRRFCEACIAVYA